MGNESSNPIRNMDKRTARREYRDNFMRAILDFQLENNANPDANPQTEEQMLAEAAAREINFDSEKANNNVRVLVRKRPIFQHETDGHEFDVVTCLEGRTAVIHDTRMHADMRRMLITNNTFAFDGVFHERSTNEVVYQSAAFPLVKEAIAGGYATVCVYGQTGSGKSFTMTSIYEKAAHDIFRELHSNAGRMEELPRVSMSFFELQGEACLDLLNTFHPTSLLTGQDGGVHATPVVEPTVSSAEEMVALIQHALSIRSTSATGVHDASSRSHAILRIYVEQPAVEISDGEAMMRKDQHVPLPCKGEGVLTLVDLAGSEQSIDSMYHTAELRKEGAAINSSLMALKDCVRAKASGSTATHIYRKSKLTMALKDSFVLPTARTVIIATVSPSSKDTEHSLNTLRHACLMDGQSQSKDGEPAEKRFITGGVKSETYQIGEVDVTAISRKNRELKKKNGEIASAKTSNGNYLGKDVAKGPMKKPPPELTDKQKAKARRIADRAGLSRLAPTTRELLLAHRESLGHEQQQINRLRRNVNPYIPQSSVGFGRDVSQSPPPAPLGAPPGMQYSEGGGQDIDEPFRYHGGQQYHIDKSQERSSFDSTEVRSSIDSNSGVPKRPLSARLTAPTAAAARRQIETEQKLRDIEDRKQAKLQKEIADQDGCSDDEELENYVVEKLLQERHMPVQNSPRVSVSNADEVSNEDDSQRGSYEQQYLQQTESQINQGRDQVLGQADSDDRKPFWKLYVQVYGQDIVHRDAEQKDALNRQLATVMRMHGYQEMEIEKLIAAGRPQIPMQRRSKIPNRSKDVESDEAGQPNAQPRKSHMSNYGGFSSANGSRNAVTHNTLQKNELSRANLTSQPPRERSNIARVNANARQSGVQTAAEKLEAEAKLREERRARAKAVMQAKDEATREAAREKNRADMRKMQELQMQHAAETVDKEATIKEQRRQNALKIKEQRENEHRKQALQRLQDKGMFDKNSPRNRDVQPHSFGDEEISDTDRDRELYRSASEQPRASPQSSTTNTTNTPSRRLKVDTSADDAEIARLTKLVVNARYQPVDVQMKLKKQLTAAKMNKTRREKGEPTIPLSPESHEPNNTSVSAATAPSTRPSSAGTRPASAGDRTVRSSQGYMQPRQSSSRDNAESHNQGYHQRPGRHDVNTMKSRQNPNHGASGEVKMPAQLRKEVRGERLGALQQDGHSSPEQGRGYGSHLGSSGVESLTNLENYTHSTKRVIQPPGVGQKRQPVQNSPPRAASVTNVHMQGRPHNSRGGYRLGAGAAPFGNAMNSPGPA